MNTASSTLGPHVDNPQSLLTYIVYLPRDNRQKQLGTGVHTLIDEADCCAKYKANKSTGVWFADARELLPEKFAFPYKRNSMAVLLNLPTSVHSAQFDKIADCRYALQTQVLLRDDLQKALYSGWTMKGIGGY